MSRAVLLGRRALVVAGAFGAGCLPSARLASRLFGGPTITSLGDGNPGASNVRKAYGLPAALLVAGMDVFKGWFPVYLARRFRADANVAGAVYVAPVLAHIAVVGGKGAAAALGACHGWDPPAMMLVEAGLIWGTAKGYHAPAVAAALVGLPSIQWLLGRSPRTIAWTLVCTSLLVWGRLRGSHRGRQALSPRVLRERLLWDREAAGLRKEEGLCG
ncbi:MAG: hypothetical protein GXX83_00690 [Gaiellales bacterium]|nr:hypothetical protein [Gaiellales bacterium]